MVSSLSSYNVQFGFLPGHSCLQQLLLFLRSVVISQEKKLQQDVVYLDIKKAFDSIPYGELLMKLHQVSIVGNLWNLFKDYLTLKRAVYSD